MAVTMCRANSIRHANKQKPSLKAFIDRPIEICAPFRITICISQRQSTVPRRKPRLLTVFAPADDQNEFHEIVQGFAVEEVAPVATEPDAKGEFHFELSLKIAELGLAGRLGR